MAYVSQEDLIIYVDGITQFNAGEDCDFRIIVYKDYLDTQLTLENVDAITVTIFDDVGRRVLSYTYPNIPGKTLPLSIGGTGTSTEQGFIEFTIAGADSQQFVPNDVYATVSFVWTDYYPAPKTITTPKIKIGDVSGATGPQPQLPNDVIGERGPKGEPGSGGAGGSIIPGPKGDKGDTGQKGATGDKGETGTGGDVAGAKGDQGAQGVAGQDGAQGAAGQDGAQGAAGQDGAQGTAGQDGAQGAAGQDGAQGAAGQDGAQGAAGEKGEKGLDGNSVAGTKGEQGAQGTAGQKGEQGPEGQGQTGVQGAAGQDGAQGAAGQKGEQGQGQTGVQGAAGQTGVQGAAGQDGAQGAAGQDGAQGAAGQKGEQGPEGQGQTGAQGAAGQKGEQGQGQKGEQGEKGAPGSGGGSGSSATLYLARIEFDASLQTNSISFDDPNSDGMYTTLGAVGTIGSYPTISFSFSGEDNPPTSVIVFGWKASANQYTITHLVAGTANKDYLIEANSNTLIPNSSSQYETDIFGNFSSASIKIAMEADNFDIQKQAGGFGSTGKNTHAYVLFTFNN